MPQNMNTFNKKIEILQTVCCNWYTGKCILFKKKNKIPKTKSLVDGYVNIIIAHIIFKKV